MHTILCANLHIQMSHSWYQAGDSGRLRTSDIDSGPGTQPWEPEALKTRGKTDVPDT